MAKDYAFVTSWRFDAPPEAVWDVLVDSHAWPRFWPYVASVEERAPGDASGIGSVRRYTWTSRLPYRLAFDLRVTKIEKPRLLEGEATGELEGLGRWTLTPDGTGTAVRYDWIVRTTKPWMNLLAPLARPAFSWNHDGVMAAGEKGFREELARRALSARAARPSSGAS